MKKVICLFCMLAVIDLSCATAFAEGPHDMDCMDCHHTHYAKADYAIGIDPKTDAANPARTRTGMTAEGIDATCLGCHNEAEGIMPVNLSTTHPTGVRPTYTPVPEELLWEGKFTCVSCHNPHPSNANYKYLIVSTGETGGDMGVFCAKCHPAQSDKMVIGTSQQTAITVDPNVAPVVRVK